jgi:hypothetical protein
MAWVGTSASAINTTGLGTLQFYRHARKGNFEVWGATGSDGDSHLEHLRYIGEFLQDLPLASVPEPSTAFVLSMLPLSMLTRRRR